LRRKLPATKQAPIKKKMERESMSIMAGDRNLNNLAGPPGIGFDPYAIGFTRHAAIDATAIRDQNG
jgi:hypothetical protein